MEPHGLFRYRGRPAVAIYRDEGTLYVCRCLGTRTTTFEEGVERVRDRCPGFEIEIGSDMKSEVTSEEDMRAYLEDHRIKRPRRT